MTVAILAFVIVYAFLIVGNQESVAKICNNVAVACEDRQPEKCTLPVVTPPGHIRVRGVIGISATGDWAIAGDSETPRHALIDEVMAPGDSIRWVVTDVPLPPSEELTATVEIE
tara:strand:+ start:1289 stop:1630 length:342 start_codon:yes stop_codon:yes gene_type:complete